MPSFLEPARRSWPAWLLLTLPGILAGDRPHCAAADGPPVFVARTAEGPMPRGELLLLEQGWSVRLGGDVPATVAAGQLLSLRQAGAVLPPFPGRGHVLLTTGDRIPTSRPRLIGEKLFLSHPDLSSGRDTQVPFEMVSILWWKAPDQVVDATRLRRELERGQRKYDLLLLANGDRLEGSLVRLDGDNLVMEVQRRTVTLGVERIAALALSTELAEKPRPRGPVASVVLAGGAGAESTRLLLSTARCRDGLTLEGQTLFGAELKVPLERVLGLDIRGGAAEPLSARGPARYRYTPYLDLQWPLAVDATVTGGDLRLEGSTHELGLGMHATSQATWELGGAYRRLTAGVGLDPEARDLGAVRVRVLLDGKEAPLPGKGVLRDGAAALDVDLDLRDVRELTLEVLPADRGSVQARVSWVNPLLIK